jgi:primosomal replication protein N
MAADVAHVVAGPTADTEGLNRVVLSAVLVEKKAMRYTPAGLPALNVSLKHESTLSEDGQVRKVSMELRAVAIGGITQRLGKMVLGSQAHFAGFLASARNGRGLLLHITSVDAAS